MLFNKSLLQLIAVFVINFFGCVAERKAPITKYGINAISTTQEYKKLVAGEPTKALVELKQVIPNISLDIRYATSNNLMSRPMYTTAAAYLALPAANALQQVQKQLNQLGYGLKIYDAYRPYAVTVAFYEKVKDTVFVASAYRGSRHNRGCAVDLTVIDLKTGNELPMPTPFDDFTEKAHSNYANLPSEIIKNRDLLKKAMTENGFQVYADEWWHFDYQGWKDHPLLDISFEQLSRLKP